MLKSCCNHPGHMFSGLNSPVAARRKSRRAEQMDVERQISADCEETAVAAGRQWRQELMPEGLEGGRVWGWEGRSV